MVTLFARHGVVDYDNWKSGYDGAVQLRKDHGVIADTVHRDVANNAAIVTHKFKDQNTATAYAEMLGSPETGKLLQEMGVLEPITTWLGEDA